MDKRDLQQLLNQPYEQENWKRIVQFVFPNVSILAVPKEFPINNDKIVRFSQIGSVRLNDEKNLALFELLLADNVNLQRNRVELNNEISKYIDQEQIHGVLSVFEQGGDDYRFTFSAKSTEFDEEESDFVSVKTDTKRFTYVLGKNESCKTPAKRFYELSENKENATIKAIQRAFSVEKLSKEFFDRYKKEFEKFWNYIASENEYKKLFLEQDKDKQIRDFTKKLLGRIVFLHFLQKKGWMGCDSSKEGWEDGDKQFMQNLFQNFKTKERFHSKCLSQLFFDTLNNGKRENNTFHCDELQGNLNGSKIPYLNGGLFDTDADISKKIDFPVSYFEELLEFFSQYNFTIDENDPNDHEVGIDPEMLGHIFENLLEDNKDKGAFYTPKIIVQYMCQESLIEYISTKLNAENNSDKKSAIENLIRKQLAQEVNDLDIAEPIAQALYDVKICDPAIGSGAFPMGILNEIYQIIYQLWDFERDSVAEIWKISNSDWEPHLVKKNIIQHSIYGVDLESGAVDIARLRFWLALVVDEEEPMPLPNLDYKIMQGNSLLESFEGIDLSKISDASAYEEQIINEQIDMFTGEAKKKVEVSLNFEDIKTLMDEYFEASDPETKLNIHKRIDSQILNHIRFTLNKHKSKIAKEAARLEKKLKLDEAAVSTWEQKERIRTKSKSAKLLEKLNEEIRNHSVKEMKLGKLSTSNERPFFLWHLFFKEVFDLGGFDIVIGNPPYGAKIEKQHQKLFREKYSDIEFKIDSYQVFNLKANELAKDGGCVSFIIPSGLMDNFFSKKIRQNLLERELVAIIELDDNVFSGAVVHSMIVTWKTNASNGREYNIKCNIGSIKPEFEFQTTSNFFINEENFNFSIRKVQFEAIIKLLFKDSFRLEDVLKIKDGIDTGDNKKYVSDTPIEGWKKLIGGSDIERWNVLSKRYVNYGNHLANPRDPELFENPKIVIRETGNRIIATLDEQSHYALSTLYSGYLLDDRFSLRSILGLLHSEIAHFFLNLMAFGRTKGAFTKTRIFHYYSLPVNTRIIENQDVLDSMVELILLAKNEGSEVSSLEYVLSQLYYAIYLQDEVNRNNIDLISKVKTTLESGVNDSNYQNVYSLIVQSNEIKLECDKIDRLEIVNEIRNSFD